MTPRVAIALGEIVGIIIFIVVAVHIVFSISRTASNTKKQLDILRNHNKNNMGEKQ